MKKALLFILLSVFFESAYCQVYTPRELDADTTYDNKISIDFYRNIYLAYRSYNAGVRAFNYKQLTEAHDHMQTVVAIHDKYKYDVKALENFNEKKQFDTIAATASMIMATCKYLDGKYADAIPLLRSARNNPITQIPAVYAYLVAAYKTQKDTAEALKIIQEGRRLFPDDVTLRNHELNYLIYSDTNNDLLGKLYDALEKEPRNPILFYNIATTYLLIAMPKSGEKPINSKDLIERSEEAFQQAIKLDPDNAEYNYNFGALYFNQATEVNDGMNAIINAPGEQKKYDSLRKVRNRLFIKSTPYLEQAYDIYSAKKKRLRGADRKTYKSTLLALKIVYEKQHKVKKAKKMKKKYDSMK